MIVVVCLQDPNTGFSTNTPLETFTITPGRRYRFRMINSLASVCPAQLTIQGHPLVLIATDGEPVHPVVVNTIISFSGNLQSFEHFQVVYAFFFVFFFFLVTSSRYLIIICTNIYFRFSIVRRREIRLHYQRRTACWRVLDPSQRFRRMRQQKSTTISHTEIRERAISTKIKGAHL